MNKLAIATLMTLGIGFSGLAMANPISAQLNSVSAGVTGSFMNYQEKAPAGYGPSDVETGFVPGFTLRASGTPSLMGMPLYTALSYSQSGARMNYKAGDVRTLDNASFYRIGGSLGMPFYVSRDVALVPYITGGYRHWNRDLEGSGGYNEVYTNEYAGLGVKGYMAMSRRLVLGAYVNADAVVGGSVTAYGFVPQRAVTAPFDVSMAESVGLSANYSLNRAVGLYGDIGYSHLNYTGGPVEGVPGAFEPNSQTNQVGIGAGVRVYF